MYDSVNYHTMYKFTLIYDFLLVSLPASVIVEVCPACRPPRKRNCKNNGTFYNGWSKQQNKPLQRLLSGDIK